MTARNIITTIISMAAFLGAVFLFADEPADPVPTTILQPAPAIETKLTATGAVEAKPEPIRTEIFECTAYSYTGSRTATGTWPKLGTVAADPKVLPYGTKIYIPAINYYGVVEDCGGAIHGPKLDLYMSSKYECHQFGRQWMEVQILEVPDELSNQS